MAMRDAIEHVIRAARERGYLTEDEADYIVTTLLARAEEEEDAHQ